MESRVKVGYLTKRAVKSGRNWKKRWFILDKDKNVLEYYEKEGQRKPKGQFELTPETVVSHSDKGDFCFQLETPTKVYANPQSGIACCGSTVFRPRVQDLYACADSASKKCEWVNALMEVIDGDKVGRFESQRRNRSLTLCVLV